MTDTTLPLAAHASEQPRPPVAPIRYGYRVRDIHGEHFDDPWDWLRDAENPDVLAHLHAENAWADHVCASTRPLADRIVEEIRSHTALTDVSVPVRDGNFWWFSRWHENRDYRTHHRVPVTESTENLPPAVTPGVELPGEQLILDENLYSEGEEFFRLGDLQPSPCGKFFAWSADTSGDERWTWRIVEADTGRVLDDSVSNTGVGLAWAADSSGFMYSRLDDAWRQHELWWHQIGTDSSLDIRLLHEADERFDLWFSTSADPHHVAIHATSPTTSQVWLWDTRYPQQVPFTVTNRETGVLIMAEPAGDHLLLIHNLESPEGTLVAAPLPTTSVDSGSVSVNGSEESVSSRDQWVTVRKAEPGVRILEAEAHATYVAISLRFGALTHVEYRTRCTPATSTEAPVLDDLWSSGSLVAVDSPVRTIATSFSGPFDSPTLRIVHHSVTVPPTWEQVDPVTGQHTHLKTLPVPGWDPNAFTEERVWVTARDGHTQIPVTLVRRNDVVADGTNAGWMHGYGAYEISFDAEFDVLRLPALRRGVIHAIAHIRGGGDMGRAWYDDGKMLKKRHSFTDFVDVAQWLVDSHWVASDRLIAEGRSAGGLLMGAMMNEAPDRFAAVLAGVAFVDALSTILDASLPLTAGEWEEWGNPIEDAEVYRYMRSYTPYENVRDGVRYPAVMATTSLNDTRVFHVEPTKWVQRLRQATVDVEEQSPIVLRTEMVAGHGGPSGREGRWHARSEEFAFALGQVGIQQ